MQTLNERKSSDPKSVAYAITRDSHAAYPDWGPANHASDPAKDFGHQATRSSAVAAIKAYRELRKKHGSVDMDNPEHVEHISKAIHGSPSDFGGQARGWSKAAIDLGEPYQTPERKAKRATLTGPYGGLSDSEKEKDRVIARTVAKHFGKKRLDEDNPLAKVDMAMKNTGKRGKTAYMATISADRGGMSKKEKHEAHGKLQAAIRRHIEKGMLRMIGGPKQSGEYRYADPEPGEEGVAKEKSYVLAPGSHKKARTNFHRIMTKLGRDAGQESVLKITKVGKTRPAGSLLYTTGPKTGTSEKVGRMQMNAPMTTGSGRTKFKNKEASIVVKE